MAEELGRAYLADLMRGFQGYKRLAESAVAQLSEVELFQQIDPESNSVAIIMKHISGSMRSRFTDFLTSDGEKPGRGRDREFEQDRMTREELMRGWESAWQLLFSTVEVLKPEDLLQIVTIRGEEHTILQALNRALTHYTQHVGQIVFLAKHVHGSDWKTLSIPRGKSEEYKSGSPGYKHGLPIAGEGKTGF
jgi:hypothetical protein